jgi:hypothetical protein
MADLFEQSMVTECVDDFLQYLHRTSFDPLEVPSTLHEAIQMWLLSSRAFLAVGDDYELFLRVVIAIWLSASSDCQPYWIQAEDSQVLLSLTVASNDDTIWLLPEFFRHCHYQYLHTLCAHLVSVV